MLALALCASMTATARGAVTFSLVEWPSAIQLPGSQTLTYKLRAVTGTDPERFSIRVEPPRFGGANSIEGAALSAGGPTLTGPGMLGYGSGSFPSTAACSTINQPGYHGNFDGSFRRDVELPPLADSVLSFNLTTAAAAPWPGNSYAPTFVADPDIDGPGVGTLPAAVAIKAPEPVLVGRSGVRVDFHTSPPSEPPIGFGGPTTIRKGQPISVKGSTSPPLKRQFLRLFYAGPSLTGQPRPKPKRLAKVRTNRAGHFAHKGWKPKKLGNYEVAIRYASQRPYLASDATCSRSFKLTAK